MNGTDLSREIEALGRFLDMAYLPRTAEAVRRLSTIDLRRVSREMWHVPVVEEYRREVEHSLNILGEPDHEHHRRLVDILDSLVGAALRHPDEFAEFLLSAHLVIEAIGESHGNTREMYRSFISNQASSKHVFLTLCLMYLILCEGVFRNQARLLLGLRAVADRDDSATSLLVKPLSPKVLQETLEKEQLGAYAAGYNRHIRNAIAHGHMRFIAGTNEMRFQDIDLSNPATPRFDETWLFARFALLYAKLDDTYLVVSTYLQVHFMPLMVGGSTAGVKDRGRPKSIP